MWSAFVNATTSDSRAMEPETPEGCESADVDGAAATSAEAPDTDTGFWGGISSFVNSQIAAQAAALEEEQAKVSADRKPVDGAGQLPWLDASDAVKEQILGLSEDERPFCQEAPSAEIFDFDLKANAAQALAACEWDDRLSQMRYRLVPSQITDEQFWRNYFYRARLIMEMPNLLGSPSTEESRGGTVAGSAPQSEASSDKAVYQTDQPDEEGSEFISDDFAGGEDFESDAWRREMQAELGLDNEDDGVLGDEGLLDGDWDKDLANELEDLQKEIDDGM